MGQETKLWDIHGRSMTDAQRELLLYHFDTGYRCLCDACLMDRLADFVLIHPVAGQVLSEQLENIK